MTKNTKALNSKLNTMLLVKQKESYSKCYCLIINGIHLWQPTLVTTVAKEGSQRAAFSATELPAIKYFTIGIGVTVKLVLLQVYDCALSSNVDVHL